MSFTHLIQAYLYGDGNVRRGGPPPETCTVTRLFLLEKTKPPEACPVRLLRGPPPNRIVAADSLYVPKLFVHQKQLNVGIYVKKIKQELFSTVYQARSPKTNYLINL